MLSAAWAGYVPVGIDIKLDALKAARRVLRSHGVCGYVVMADLTSIPFGEATIDSAFSYSVLQHTHRSRARRCIDDVFRILKPGGSSLFEFPLSHGLTNWRHLLKPRPEEADFDSWSVRYYGWSELREIFQSTFGNSEITTDCFFGIGVRREDFDILPLKSKAIVVMSECLRVASGLLPLKYLSDSVFVQATKPIGLTSDRETEVHVHSVEPSSNLWITPLLRCPLTGSRLELSRHGDELLSAEGGWVYPVIDEIPILTVSAARRT